MQGHGPLASLASQSCLCLRVLKSTQRQENAIPVQIFCMGSRDANSGPHSCMEELYPLTHLPIPHQNNSYTTEDSKIYILPSDLT